MESPLVDLKTVEHSIPLDILSDLLSRFIINVPDSAKQNLVRICFQIELAYWYYLDFYVSNDPKLRSCSFREFASHVFQHLPFLQVHYDRLTQILEEWRDYKQSVPTYGAIMLCEGNTHVLLVQSYWAKASWGFPKGKVNEDEDPAHCAVREVYEETGYDIGSQIDPNNYLESVINEQLVRLYVVSGIPLDTAFRPRTRNEIKACEWFAISDLPNSKKDATPKVKIGVSANAFYMVLPFVKRIKSLSVGQNSGTKNKRQRNKSCSLSEGEIVTPNNANAANNWVASNASNGTSGPDGLLTGGKGNSSNNGNKRERKSQSKRQLFNNNQQQQQQQQKLQQQQHQQQHDEFVFSAPSWLNFKFNTAAIMECIQ